MLELLGGRRSFFNNSNNDVSNTKGQMLLSNKYPFPYAIVLQDDGQPVIIAVKYSPKNRVKIAPITELVIQ